MAVVRGRSEQRRIAEGRKVRVVGRMSSLSCACRPSALRRCPVRLADGKVLPVLLWIPQTLAKRFQSVLKVEQLRDCLRRERFLQVL